MVDLRSAVIAAALGLVAFPAAAGAIQASGRALMGSFAECSAGMSKGQAGLPDGSSPTEQRTQGEHSAEAVSVDRLRDYLEFHAQAREDTGAGTALMPWPALRTHAN